MNQREVNRLLESLEFWREKQIEGETVEQREAARSMAREQLAKLDALAWTEREPGETVARVRARLLPQVRW